MSEDPACSGPRLLRVPEAAAHLGLAPRTVWALIAQGRIEVIRLGARATRIPADAVTRFIEARRQPTNRGGR